MTLRTAFRAILPVLALACMAAGLLPGPELAGLWGRIWPILLFVTAMTAVTDLLFAAGVLERIIAASARLAGGRTMALWLVTVVLAVGCTVFLSLDTTAVLLTPLVVLLARRAGPPPLPFAVTIVWLANTASLLLPVSNLTNLLVQERLQLTPAAFAGLVTAAQSQGLVSGVASVAGTGEGLDDLLQLAAVGAAGANAVNNLPAYLAMEPLADSPLCLAALLIGVNLGPLVTSWGSLATLLWAERLQPLDLSIRWAPFALVGLLVTALTLPAAVVVLWWTGS